MLGCVCARGTRTLRARWPPIARPSPGVPVVHSAEARRKIRNGMIQAARALAEKCPSRRVGLETKLSHRRPGLTPLDRTSPIVPSSSLPALVCPAMTHLVQLCTRLRRRQLPLQPHQLPLQPHQLPLQPRHPTPCFLNTHPLLPHTLSSLARACAAASCPCNPATSACSSATVLAPPARARSRCRAASASARVLSRAGS